MVVGIGSQVESALAALCMEGTRIRVAVEWEEAASGEGLAVPGSEAVGEAPGAEFEPDDTGFDRVQARSRAQGFFCPNF